MAPSEDRQPTPPHGILTQEQDAVLDLYIKHLDNIFEELKLSEKLQVEIETLHLKKMLTK